jgi:undecaprenyl-diphosphatase
MNMPPSSSRSFDLRMLEPIIFLMALGFVFLKISCEVIEGESHAIDICILEAFRVSGQPGSLIGPVWLQEGMRDITKLGSPAWRG